MPLPPVVDKVTTRATTAGYGLKVLAEAGIVRPYSPLTLARLLRTVKQWGMGPAGAFMAASVVGRDRVWLVDELGELTFADVDRRTNALARALRAHGVESGSSVAIMARNHRGFVDATIAAAKLGADVLFLNTAFAGPQLVEVLEREDPVLVVHDEEFTDLIEKAHVDKRVLAWTDSDDLEDGVLTLERMIEVRGDTRPLDPPDHDTRIIILTSGTTGTPKGAPRNKAGIEDAVAMLSRLPLKYGWRVHIAAPLFHTWGLSHLFLSYLLSHTVVLRRKFDPEGALAVLDEEKCDGFVVIPVMLQRILRLPDEVLDKYSLDTVKAVPASGSALPGDLAVTWMDRYGDNLYNIYGSTEVAYVSIANPQDLREASDSAGKPPVGAEVRILDEDGREVPEGEPGRIFVRNAMLFEGYTGGGHKDMVDGFMSTGDVGRFGEDGRLYVEGRDDEMIVSGGENVFPKEVEDCIARHEAVVEVAAIGVDDDEFGKRLKAFVVLKDGAGADEDQLKAHVKDNLARYKVPREIVVLDELPRNATGKVLKRELAEHDDDDADGSSEDDGESGGDQE